MEQIGKRLRALREGVRLTQVNMAEILGVQQSRINRYETGQTTPAPEIFIKYADYFDVSMDYLYCRTDDPRGKLYDYQPQALKEKTAKKIILSRPAVEAGEKLGFLPGDMKEKIDPYLQPLYDALEDMLPAVKLQDMLEKNIIQIAPLAFMRGRTLNDAVVILDEAQNTTTAQIKMFLTRMGWNTKMIITGDLTQVDLPHGTQSGLRCAIDILKNVEGISIVRLDGKDIVRHKLVTRIVQAFDQADREQAKAATERSKEAN